MSVNKNLHIISFNIPYPADYGGVIDVFAKVKSLHAAGVKITLHCFEYGREKAPELEQYCEKVYYYPRKIYGAVFSLLPYIISSRRSENLLFNLLQDDNPILFEGLHTCYYLSHPLLKKRNKLVRMHNIEWQYYNNLTKTAQGLIKKTYFLIEAYRLKKAESLLKHASHILTISPADTKHYKALHENVSYLPPFHLNDKPDIKSGQGKYALFHGDISVEENRKAALFLIKEVFNDIELPLCIAGKSASKIISEEEDKVRIINDPEEDTLKTLIQNAHINILPAFQSSGMKLKLINAMFNGRFCLVNNAMVQQTGLEKACIIVEGANEMKLSIQNLMQKEFTTTDIEARKVFLLPQFDNMKNAAVVARLI